MKRVMLYFGSFNPIHNGHMALAEYVVEEGLCDELIMVVSPQNPLKSSAELALELERFTMAELACGASKYPERIKPSIIEFLLPKPSYTVETLRHLNSEYGTMMKFSILMGGDLVGQLDQWRDYEEILRDYPIYVYPREGEAVDKFADHITLLNGAPLMAESSTDIRMKLMRGEDVSQMVCGEVLKHIKSSNLWDDEAYISLLNRRIDSDPQNADNYVERGQWHYRRNAFGKAMNDFNRALKIEPNHVEAQQMAQMTKEILEYRYTEIYNP